MKLAKFLRRPFLYRTPPVAVSGQYKITYKLWYSYLIEEVSGNTLQEVFVVLTFPAFMLWYLTHFMLLVFWYFQGIWKKTSDMKCCHVICSRKYYSNLSREKIPKRLLSCLLVILQYLHIFVNICIESVSWTLQVIDRKANVFLPGSCKSWWHRDIGSVEDPQWVAQGS